MSTGDGTFCETDLTRDFERVADSLAGIGRGFYQRGWMLGTSGNLSAVVGRDPLRVAITASGVEKGQLARDRIVEVNSNCDVVRDTSPRPSAETRLHVGLIETGLAECVLHTHSVWGTLVSERFASDGGFAVENHEMLKGLAGVGTHVHREWMPIVENSQDMNELWEKVKGEIDRGPIHGVLILRHGLYTWGRSIDEAHRHVEIFEFLLEVSGRSRAAV